LHANKARFQRATLNKGQGADHKKVANLSRPNSGDSGSYNSYVNAVKNHKSVDHDSPAIVLDEDCALSKDLSSSLMEFSLCEIERRHSVDKCGVSLLVLGKFAKLLSISIMMDKKSVNDFEEEKLNKDDGDSNNSNLKENVDESASFGRFKKSVAPRSNSSLHMSILKVPSKDVYVSFKIGRHEFGLSFRRIPRGVSSKNQFDILVELVHSVTIVPSADRWNWNLESTGIFSVASARRRIDEICLPNIGIRTLDCKVCPDKKHVLAGKSRPMPLPTRFNISS
ncbi:hypothetical protein Tco_1064699, partial [Tanacetum coccineum]